MTQRFFLVVLVIATSLFVSGIVTPVTTSDAQSVGNADVLVYRVGVDGTVNTAPVINGAVAEVFVNPGDSQQYSFANPALYSNVPVRHGDGVTVRNYSAGTTDSPQINETVGICSYLRGGTECTPSVYQSTTVISTPSFPGPSRSYASIPSFNVQDGYVTKVVFKYDTTTVGQVQVFQYGQNGSITTAPSDMSSGSPQVPEVFIPNPNESYTGSGQRRNPADKGNISPTTTQRIAFRDLSGYDEVLGYCTYPINTAQCTVDQFTTSLQSEQNGSENFFIGLVPVLPNQVTKVGIKYTDKSGDASLVVLGTNNQLIQNPGVYAHIGDSNSYFYSQEDGNPKAFYNLEVGNTEISFSQVTASLVSVLYCQYDRPTANGIPTGCTPSISIPVSLQNVGYQTKYVGTLPIADGKISNVIIRLNTAGATSTTGNVLVKRVGQDDTVSTAPCTAADVNNQNLASCGNYGPNPANPSNFANISTGANTVYVTNIPGYSIQAGICQFPAGGTECRITTFTSPITCPVSGPCSVPISVSAGQVTKVAVKYIAGGTSGAVRLKLVGPDDTVYSTSQNETWVNTVQTPNSPNPVYLSPIAAGVNTFSVRRDPVSTLSAGVCTYAIGAGECVISTFPRTPVCDNAGLCSISETVTAGRVTKVVFKYVPTSANPTNTSGEIHVRRVGSDDTAQSAPTTTVLTGTNFAPGTEDIFSMVEPLSLLNNDESKANPIIYPSVKQGTYAVFTTDSANHVETAGICEYDIGSPQCSVSPSQFTVPITCSYVREFPYTSPSDIHNRLCFVEAQAKPGKITRVVFKYTAGSNTPVSPTGRIKVYKQNESGLAPQNTSFSFGYSSNRYERPGPYMDFYFFSNENVREFTNVSPGPRGIYAQKDPNQLVEVRTCQYPNGGTECTPTGQYVPMVCGNIFTGIVSNHWQGMAIVDPPRAYQDRCTHTINVSNGMTTRVDMRFVDNTGDIQVTRLDQNGTTTGVSAQTVNLNASAIGSGSNDNPSFFASTSAGINTLFFTHDAPAAVVGVCAYPRGGTPCTVSGYTQSATCQFQASFFGQGTYQCSAPIQVSGGMVHRVNIQSASFDYTLSTLEQSLVVTRGYETANKVRLTAGTGNAQPATISISGLPAGTTATINRATPVCTPTCEIDLIITTTGATPIGTHEITITSQPLNKVTTFDLQVTNESTASLRVCHLIKDQTNSLRLTSTDIATGTVSVPIASGYNVTGTLIQNVSWTTETHSPNTRIVHPTTADAACVTIANQPYRRMTYGPSVINGAGFTSAGYNDQYTQQATTLSDFYAYSAELFDADVSNDQNRNQNADGEITFPIGSTTRTLLVLTQATVSSGTGEVHIRRVGPTGSVVTLPSVTQARIGTATPVNTNPAVFPNISVGNQTIGVTDVSGYTEQFASCTHAVGSSCEPPANAYSVSGVVCASGFCSVQVSVPQDQVIRVVAKYVPTVDATSCTVNSSTTFVEAGRTVTWSVVTNPVGDYTYSWAGHSSCGTAPGNAGCQTMQNTYATPNTTVSETARVYKNGTQIATCSASVNVTRPSFIEI